MSLSCLQPRASCTASWQQFSHLRTRSFESLAGQPAPCTADGALSQTQDLPSVINLMLISPDAHMGASEEQESLGFRNE